MNRTALLFFIPAVVWLAATPYLWHVMFLGQEWWRFYYFETWIALTFVAAFATVIGSNNLFNDED